MNRTGRWLAALTVLASLAAGPAMAGVSLDYVGAFRAFSGLPQIYGGDLAYNAAGNAGVGSLLISDYPGSAGKEIFELSIPALTITANVADLQTAATLSSFDVGVGPAGMALRSTDGRLYVSTPATGSQAMNFRYINTDGTGESTTRTAPAWNPGGSGLAEVPADWAATYAGGKNLITVINLYGPRITSVDPWNDPVATPTPLVAYAATNTMTDYDYNDKFEALAWVEVGSEANIIVAGKDNSAAAATLWFYDVADIENRTSPYSPQPYQVLSVQDRMLASNTLWGLTYDAASQTLYGYEGAWNLPTIVHAWSVVPEPATIGFVLLGTGSLLLRRRHA